MPVKLGLSLLLDSQRANNREMNFWSAYITVLSLININEQVTAELLPYKILWQHLSEG